MQEPSGQLRIRIPKDLHLDCRLNAKKNGVSLNTYIVMALGNACQHSDLVEVFLGVNEKLKKYEEQEGSAGQFETIDCCKECGV